jgi:hypothetical protein
MVCSGAMQCHVLMRARVGVRVGPHPRLVFHMRKKEASLGAWGVCLRTTATWLFAARQVHRRGTRAVAHSELLLQCVVNIVRRRRRLTYRRAAQTARVVDAGR